MRTKQLHLGHVGHPQQLLAQVVGEGFNLSVVKPIRLNRVDHAVHIAKIVVKKRSLNTRRQRGANVAHLFAHGVPSVSNVGAFNNVFDLKNDLRFARLGITANFVGVRHFLQGALNFVSHLLGHLLRGSARPVGADHHGPKGKRWVFVLPQLKVSGKAQQHQHQHQVAGQGWVV